MHKLKLYVENKYFFFTSLIILLLISGIISYPNISLDLYFNQKYIKYAKLLSDYLSFNTSINSNELKTFPIWGYGLVHWLFNSSKLGILIFQQFLNLIAIYFLDKSIINNGNLNVFFWRAFVLFSFPYFFFHTQIWPKSITSSLLIFALVQLINYFRERKKKQLIFSGIFFGVLCNFRSDYVYFILLIPFIIIFWELVNNKWLSNFSISTFIIPIITFLFLIPWGCYTYLKTNQVLFNSTNSGHVLFIGLGQLPNNKWGITPRDDDALMHEILEKKFIEKDLSSTGYQENKYLKQIFFLLISEFPKEWLKKCFNNIKLIFFDPFYVGNVGDFQKNGISNIIEIRKLENAVYEFDYKAINQIIKNTRWKFSLREVLELSITIFTKIIGILLFLATVFLGGYMLFNKFKWFIKTPLNLLLTMLISYQIAILIFVFHMPVYNTTIYLFYILFVSLAIHEVFLNPTINKNQ